MSNSNILFDPHCEVGSNVKSITVSVSSAHAKHRCIVIPFGPVYHKTLTVMHGNTELKEGVDYYAGHRYLRGTHMTAQPLVGSIWSIKEGITGNLTIQGHSLGGEYIAAQSEIDNYFANRYQSPGLDSWEDVMGVDRYFPPVKIKFDLETWYGETALVEALETIAETKRTQDQTDAPIWQLLNDRFNRIADIVNKSGWQQHLNDFNNPHNVKHFHIGALHEAAAAVNALKAYGKDINQLAQYVRDTGINQSHLENYVKRSVENTITGDIVLKDGRCIITGKDGVKRAVIDISSGNIKIISHGNVTLTSDKDKTNDGSAKLVSGTNALELRSGGKSYDSLYYNNQLVLNTENLSANIPNTGGQSFIVNHITSPSFRFTGNGTRENPLSGVITPPQAAPGLPGVVMLSIDVEDNTYDTVATPKLVSDLTDDANEKVPASRTINGMGLYTDVTINKFTFNLGNVDNTSDLDKPLTKEAQAMLDRLALKGHTHTAADLVMSNATYTEYGGARGIDPRFGGTEGTGILACYGGKYYEDLIRQELAIEKSLPAKVINAKKFFFTNDGGFLNQGAGVVNASTESRYYCNRKWYTIPMQSIDINALIPKPWNGKKFYIYVTSKDNGKFVVTDGKQPDDEFKTRLVELVCDLNGNIIKFNAQNTVLRLGSFREMTDHIKDKTAHGFSVPTLAKMGIPSATLGHRVTTFDEVIEQIHMLSSYVTVAAYEDTLERYKYTVKTGTIMSGHTLESYDGVLPPHWLAVPESITDTSSTGLHGISATMTMVNGKPRFDAYRAGASDWEAVNTPIEFILFYIK